MINYEKLAEEELFKQVAKNDMEAAKYIYDKFAPAIYGIILKRVELKEDCEEILSNTFITFFKGTYNSTLISHRIFISLHNIAHRLIKPGDNMYISHKSVSIPALMHSTKPSRH